LAGKGSTSDHTLETCALQRLVKLATPGTVLCYCNRIPWGGPESLHMEQERWMGSRPDIVSMVQEKEDVAMQDAAPSSNGAAAPDDAGKKAKKKPRKGEEDKDADLSEEDLELKKNLELMVARIAEGDPGLQAAALASISAEIRSATTSMTSVPKPLKFLRAHYGWLKEAHGRMRADGPRAALADVLSVLAITTGKEGERESLRFRLEGSKVSAAAAPARRRACAHSGRAGRAERRGLDLSLLPSWHH